MYFSEILTDKCNREYFNSLAGKYLEDYQRQGKGMQMPAIYGCWKASICKYESLKLSYLHMAKCDWLRAHDEQG